jgi:hypothetical protein
MAPTSVRVVTEKWPAPSPNSTSPNNRPGHRCRHGHTSARRRPPKFTKNVYVRQDRLLRGLRDRLLEAVGGEGAALADYLRSHGLVIVSVGPTWTIEAAAQLPAPTTPDLGGTQLLLL